MGFSRRSFLASSVATLGLAAGMLGAGGGVRAQGETIRIGAALPFTGLPFFVADGLRQLLGYRLWQDEINARGGLLGRRVRLVFADDGGTAEGGAAAYRRLIEEDRVDLLLGNYGSGAARGTIPVVEAAEVPCVFPMAWQPALWLAPHRWAVPTLPLASEVTQPLVAYLADQGVRRVAVVHADNAYASDLAAGLVRWLDEFGLERTAVQTYAFDDQGGMEAAIRDALASGPDALAGGNVGDQVPALARAATALEPELAEYAWFELDEPAILPEREVVEGMIGFGLWLPSMPYAGNRDFVARFTQRWQSEYPEIPIALLLDHHAAAGYAAAQVLEAAVASAGSLDRAKVREALFAMSTETVFGPYRLDERGVQVAKTVPVVTYRNGLREVVWPSELAT